MEDQEEEMVEVEEEVVRGDPRCRRALCTEVAPENTCMIPPVLTFFFFLLFPHPTPEIW